MLETTTKYSFINILKSRKNKYDCEIQQAEPAINQMERLQKQVAITFCYISVQLVPLEKLEHVQPLVKEMFTEELKQNVPLRGRISHFVQSWEKLTKDQENLEIENRYKISLLRTPAQEKISLNTPLKENQKFLVEKEMKEMLKNGAIKVSLQNDQLSQNQFLSNLFAVKKNGCGYQRVTNLKTLNQFVPYMHFKMESLQTLKYMMKERDYMCKINLKDAYFTVPLDKSCDHLARLSWEGNL